MRRMDCDQTRPLIGEVKIAGDTLKIFKRTIGQEALHNIERKRAGKDLEKLQKAGKGPETDEYSNMFKAWLKREVEIFIPEFEEKHFNAITYEQREDILAMIYEIDPDKATQDIKKNQKGNRRGGK